MAQTLYVVESVREKVPKQLASFADVGIMGIFGSHEVAANVQDNTVKSYLSAVSLVARQIAHALKSCAVRSGKKTIGRVLRSGRRPDVASAIVKTVAIGMVNKNTWICEPKNKSVHQKHSPASICSYVCGCIKRFGVLGFYGSPFVLSEKGGVSIVCNGKLPMRERESNHDCSFSNTLSGVAATRKVRAFGDQPSRDVLIVVGAARG